MRESIPSALRSWRAPFSADPETFLGIDTGSAAYLDLVEQLKQEIAKGVVAGHAKVYGAKVPRKPTFAQAYAMACASLGIKPDQYRVYDRV